MVKSALLNKNEDFVKSPSEQVARVTEMFSESKYSNVEEKNSLANNTELSNTPLNGKEILSSCVETGKDTHKKDSELLLDEFLGMRLKGELNEGLESLKNNEVLVDSLNTFSQLSNSTHLNELNTNDFNDSLQYVENFKGYERGNEDFFKGIFNSHVSSNGFNQFEKGDDKLDTKEVQLDSNVANATNYLGSEQLDGNVVGSNLNPGLLETMDTLNPTLESKDPLAGLYDSFNMGPNTVELGRLYNYMNNPSYQQISSGYQGQNYYGSRESSLGAFNDELAGFTEFEKGLVSMCDEASTQQGSSLLSSPEQLNNGNTTSQGGYAQSGPNNLTTQTTTDSTTAPAQAKTPQSGTNREVVAAATKPVPDSSVPMRKDSGEYYNSSTSFGESGSYSCDSLYKMDSLAQSLMYDSEYSNTFYSDGNYTPFSAGGNGFHQGGGSLGESGYGGKDSYYKNLLLLKPNDAASNLYGNNFYADETKRDDTTPFTHVVSSVATVADTITPLCSSDLNAEFSENAQALLERYLMGDLSVESELFALFMAEFNVDVHDVYNTIVKYCTTKNLYYYSYKLLLHAPHLVESTSPGNYMGSGFGTGTSDKAVTVDAYMQVLLSLLTAQDSAQLSRSLFTNLANYNTSPTNAMYSSNQYPGSSNGVTTKEGDKVLRMYAVNMVQMVRADAAVFERFLNILEDHQGRLDVRLSCVLFTYLVQLDLMGRHQFESWMGLANSDAVYYLLKVFRMAFFPRLNTTVRFAMHFLDLMLNPNYALDFLDNSKLLLLFLDYVAVNFSLSYSNIVLRMLEKKVFNAILFINSLQLALKCDYGSMITKICLSALQIIKGVVPVEFTSPTFGRFEFITLENINKLVMLISNYPNAAGAAGAGAPAANPAPSVASATTNASSCSNGSTRPSDLNSYLSGSSGYTGTADKAGNDLGTSLTSSGKDFNSFLTSSMVTLTAEITPAANMVTNLLDVCKVLFAYNNRDLFVPLVECCLLVEDFQGCECIMKYYCDYYGMVSEVICQKVLLSIALKGNFNYVNRLLKGTQSYESCEVFLTHNSGMSATGSAGSPSGASAGSSSAVTTPASAPTVSSPSNSTARATPVNGLIRLSIYLVRICISILNFNVAMNYVKPLLRLNQQNEEVSNTLMLVATRLDSRSKLDSFLSFCERTSILINEACFNVILDACIKLKNNKRLLRLINKFRMWGLYPNIQTFGVIIKSLSCCNMIQECEELFYNYLTYTSYNAGTSPKANVAHSKDMVSDLDGREGDSEYPTKDTKALKYSYSSSSLASINSSNSNLSSHTQASSKEKENYMRINEIIYGCMFDAYVNNNKVDNAMRLFEDMKLRGQVRPNTIMYTTLIKGYGQNKQLDKAMKIFRMMQQDKVVPNTVTYNSIIDACARVGDMVGATTLLEDMLMNNIEPDLITFSTIIKGYCVQSDMDKSFQLLSIMYERGIMPDVILYNSLLEGCVKSGLLWLCEKLWKQMQDYNIPPSNFTLTILIKMYGRSGQLDKVFELADELPKRYNFSINTHVYTCLMSACITNGRYEMVLDIYKYMKKNGVKPDAKTFETIIQGLSRGALFREAAQVVMEVYSLTNSNNGEAQISNINSKIIERLFQRYYSYVNTGNAGSPNQGSNCAAGNRAHTALNTPQATAQSKDAAKDKLKNGKSYKDDILLNVANSVTSGYAGGYSGNGSVPGLMEDPDELNSMYTSLARRLELFGIKIPRFQTI